MLVVKVSFPRADMPGEYVTAMKEYNLPPGAPLPQTGDWLRYGQQDCRVTHRTFISETDVVELGCTDLTARTRDYIERALAELGKHRFTWPPIVDAPVPALPAAPQIMGNDVPLVVSQAPHGGCYVTLERETTEDLLERLSILAQPPKRAAQITSITMALWLHCM